MGPENALPEHSPLPAGKYRLGVALDARTLEMEKVELQVEQNLKNRKLSPFGRMTCRQYCLLHRKDSVCSRNTWLPLC